MRSLRCFGYALAGAAVMVAIGLMFGAACFAFGAAAIATTSYFGLDERFTGLFFVGYGLIVVGGWFGSLYCREVQRGAG
jgi:hypothetical protein